MELTSLLSSPRLAVFTATASKSTKRKIFEALKLNYLTTCVIEKDPNKDNLRYVVKYIENDLSLNDIFHTLISELRSKSTETEGTLVFCRTRKQCSLIFRAITAAIGNSVYYGKASPKNRIVEMFHAGTPDSVKNHIIATVTSNWGHIRVLICTIAFGMGIDCQYISRIIHFGGSKCIESYLQECGRAGRKGQLSTCILYYNGMLMRYSADDMKNYTSSKVCRRKEISSVFPNSKNMFEVSGCSCCDICAINCNCGKTNCLRQMGLLTKALDEAKPTKARKVSKEARQLLAEKLESYRQSLLPDNLDNLKPVSFPTMFFEFGSFQCSQVLKSCHLLFSLADIKSNVEIWRDIHANNVLVALHEVFDDFHLDTSKIQLSCHEEDTVTCIDSDWVDIRDDSSLLDIASSRLYENMDLTADDADTSQNCGTELNTSAMFESMATESLKFIDSHFENTTH